MRPLKRNIWLVCLATLALAAYASDDKPKLGTRTNPADRLKEEVRHQLVMLPFYGVFDNLEYSVQGDTVVLSGQVTRPTLRSDAESAVKSLEGVTKLINNIEILPLSPSDDQIRKAAYRAIFSSTGLERYAMMAVPSIHIVVRNGHVVLTGIVNNDSDKTQAELAAKGVSGVFSVTDNLRTEKR